MEQDDQINEIKKDIEEYNKYLKEDAHKKLNGYVEELIEVEDLYYLVFACSYLTKSTNKIIRYELMCDNKMFKRFSKEVFNKMVLKPPEQLEEYLKHINRYLDVNEISEQNAKLLQDKFPDIEIKTIWQDPTKIEMDNGLARQNAFKYIDNSSSSEAKRVIRACIQRGLVVDQDDLYDFFMYIAKSEDYDSINYLRKYCEENKIVFCYESMNMEWINPELIVDFTHRIRSPVEMHGSVLKFLSEKKLIPNEDAMKQQYREPVKNARFYEYDITKYDYFGLPPKFKRYYRITHPYDLEAYIKNKSRKLVMITNIRMTILALKYKLPKINYCSCYSVYGYDTKTRFKTRVARVVKDINTLLNTDYNLDGVEERSLFLDICYHVRNNTIDQRAEYFLHKYTIYEYGCAIFKSTGFKTANFIKNNLMVFLAACEN